MGRLIDAVASQLGEKKMIDMVVLDAPAGDGRLEVEKGLGMMLDRLWRFALTQCGDRSLADDLVQSTCTRALERADQFQPGSRLDAWLFSILVSIWRNMARSITVRRGQGLVDAVDAQLEAPSADNETRLHLRQVMLQIAKLPEGQRSVILLVCVEGFTYAETAAALDIPVGTVMSRLCTARKYLHALKINDA
ncbi:MAG: RNA polymerase sigma factor [Pseudomonadota bacterium]